MGHLPAFRVMRWGFLMCCLFFGMVGSAEASRVFQSGFETGDTVEWADYLSGAAMSNSPVKTGGYALSLNGSSRVVRSPGTFGDDLYVRFGFWWAGTTPSVAKSILTLYTTGASGSDVAKVRLTTGGLLEFLDKSGTVLGTTPAPTANEWHDLSLHVRVNAAGVDTDGNDLVEYRIDDGAVTSFSTAVVGTATNVAFKFGHAFVGGGTAVPVLVDDVKVNSGSGTWNNSWPIASGVVRLDPGAASGNAGYQQWTGTYDDVNDLGMHDGDATVVVTAIPGALESFRLAADQTAAVGDKVIGAAQLVAVAKMGGSSPANASNELLVRSAGTDSLAAKTFSTGFKGYFKVDELDPATRAPWTGAQLAQAEIGLRAGAAAGEANMPTVTQLSWMVEVGGTAPSGLHVGGLTQYPQYQIGPNLLNNSGLEELGTNGDPAGWSDNGFAADDTVAHTGVRSYRITNSNLISGAQSAFQTLFLKKGAYRIGAWIKLDGMGVTQGNGIRVAIRPTNAAAGAGETNLIKGTREWQFVQTQKIVITQDGTAQFKIELHGEPDGTAWVDDVTLQEEYALPINVFVKYPNFRGMLFDDQTSIITADLTVTPPAGTVLGDYTVVATAVDEQSNTVMQRQVLPAIGNMLATFDSAAWPLHRTYLLRFQLVRIGDGAVVYEYPFYRVVRLPASVRSSLPLSFDEHNRFLVYGKPTFVLQTYDSGIGFTNSVDTWERNLTTARRLFELPVDLYLHYTLGNASDTALKALMDSLWNRHHILYLQTGNCLTGSFQGPETKSNPFNSDESDDFVRSLATHPGFAGFYTADECDASLAERTFTDRQQRFKTLNPTGVTFGGMLPRPHMTYWPEALDILGVDGYPMYGAEPVGGYPFFEVGDQTKMMVDTVHDSRPSIKIIQFFKFTSKGRWPTQDELRNMSYMAIADGANGLSYWSLGINALAYVTNCSAEEKNANGGWCLERTEYFNRLKNVMTEIKGLEAALTSLDRPDLLIGTDNAGIHTRIKYRDGKAYLIAYNHENTTTTATFTWNGTPVGVNVYNENRTLTPDGAHFTDTFAPYQAHVYEITN